MIDQQSSRENEPSVALFSGEVGPGGSSVSEGGSGMSRRIVRGTARAAAPSAQELLDKDFREGRPTFPAINPAPENLLQK